MELSQLLSCSLAWQLDCSYFDVKISVTHLVNFQQSTFTQNKTKKKKYRRRLRAKLMPRGADAAAAAVLSGPDNTFTLKGK